MTFLPSLGPRGEGWVLIQGVLLVIVAAAGWSLGPDWSGPLQLAGTVVGIVLISAGLVLAFRGFVDLDRALTPLPRPRDGAELVETGAYALVRHPIYSGLILAAFGWGIAQASIVAVALAVVLAAFLRVKSAREEAWLEQRFPAYAAYRARTPRLIPSRGTEPIPLDSEEAFMTHSRSRERTDAVTKLIPASAEQLYGAFADGETLMQWLPPPNMTGRALDYEFREGGAYRIELRYRDGSHGVGKTTGDRDMSSGRFVHLVPNRMIRETVEFETNDEALAHGMTMTWAFKPRQGATEVTVMAENVPAAIGQKDHLAGLTASLENLARFVAQSHDGLGVPDSKTAHSG